MPLQLPQGSRFKRPSPDDALPAGAVSGFDGFIGQIAAQGDRRDLLEHFKGYFCSALGVAHWASSDESWAQTDLTRYMDETAKNAPLFVGTFYDACEALRSDELYDLPGVELMNEVLREHGVLLEIRPPHLVRVGAVARVPIPEPPPTLEDDAASIIRSSLQRSEELLAENRPLEAVQQMLWILESLVTAFRGVQLHTGTVEGRYFNEIARELQAASTGTTLHRVVDWTTKLHGYLSSPTGGGVRHGLDLNCGTTITLEEGRLFCNLILSYVTYLMSEHARLQSP